MNDTCSIDGCNLGETSDAIRRGFCELHYYRFRQYGDPLAPSKVISKRNGAPTRYTQMHYRITKARGRARDYICEHCGKRAGHWAYDGEDPDERIDAVDGRRVFSAKLEHYHPLCESCHRRLDWDRFYAPSWRHADWRPLKAACIHGHPYDEANTIYRPGPGNKRACRTCTNIRANLYRHVSREERLARKAAGLPVVDLAAYFAHSTTTGADNGLQYPA